MYDMNLLTDPSGDSTVPIIIVVVVVVVSIAILALIIVGFICICVCCKKSKTRPSAEEVCDMCVGMNACVSVCVWERSACAC